MRKTVFCMIAAVSVCAADIAVQTDWSGVSGIQGPVMEYGCDFYIDTDVRYRVEGQLEAGYGITEFSIIPSNVHSKGCVSCDVDQDGDIDLIFSILSGMYEVIWLENQDGSGTSWIPRTVCDVGCMRFTTGDFNGDDFEDIIGYQHLVQSLSFWENPDNSGQWPESTLFLDANFSCLESADINGDGFLDLLAVTNANSASELVLSWWENVDNTGTNWDMIVIDEPNSWVNLFPGDIDNDGHMDIVAAKENTGSIYWYENTDGSGLSWDSNLVDGDFGTNGVILLSSADIDNDGDVDIVGESFLWDQMSWWENLNGNGKSWLEHSIEIGGYNQPASLITADMDIDGDIDIVSGSSGYGARWWENVDAANDIWIMNVMIPDPDYSEYLSIGDFDGDGLPDIGACGTGWFDKISWLRIDHCCGSLESSILNLNCDPQWGSIDWNSTEPPETSVRFQVRASDDYEDMGGWSDTLYSPCSLSGILDDNDSYLQYRAIINISDPAVTPVLDDITVTWNPVTIAGGESPVAWMFTISPNPSLGIPVVRYSLTEPGSVEIVVFDISGRVVSENQFDVPSAGYHTLQLDRMIPGIYFCKMTVGEFNAIREFVVIQ